MKRTVLIDKIIEKYNKGEHAPDACSRRLWAAKKAIKLGHGGILVIHKITGISRKTISKGIKELPCKKTISNAPGCNIRKSGSGRIKQIKDEEVKANINKIFEIEKTREQNLSINYSSLSLRELASELKEKAVSISHVSLLALLKKQDYFIYGANKNNQGYPRIAREIHIKQIHINTTLFHQRGNPVVFIDIQKVSKPGSVEIGKGHAVLLNVIVEWWNDLDREKFSNSSEILIFINGGPLKINKGIFRKFADSTGLTTTFCHIPAGIIKWVNIEPTPFNKTISIRQKNKQIYCNASIYVILKAEGRTKYDFEAMQSFMINASGDRRIDYLSPPEWYYTLKPTSKENKT